MLENHDDNDKTIFVGNLHSSVKEEILYELFLQAGPVQKVIIPRDRDGRQRSYGFVHYKHAEAVPYATDLLNGIWLCGRPIRLKHCFDHTLQMSEAVSPDLGSIQQMHRFQQQGEHSWSDVMAGLAIAHSLASVSPVLGSHWPPVATASSTAPLWLWPDSSILCSNGQTQVLGCTNSSEGDNGQNLQSGKRHKQRGNHEKRHKRKRRH